jgi:hypothetical protein
MVGTSDAPNERGDTPTTAPSPGGPRNKRDARLLGGLALCGLASTWLLGLELFDSVDAVEPWVRGAAGLLVGLIFARVGLGFTGVAPEDRWPGACWAVVPWYFFFASQLAYLGYLLIPFELWVGAGLLTWRTRLPMGRALAIALAARVAIFLVHTLA